MIDQKSLESWLIVGAGAIGLLWACKLQKAGHTVTVLTKNTNKPQPVVFIKGKSKSVHQIDHTVLKNLSFGHSHILICTKAFDQVRAYNDIKNHLSSHAYITTLCNGMGVQDELQSTLLKHHILIAGSTTEGAFKHNQNTVEQTGSGANFFGFFNSKHDSSLPFPTVLQDYREFKISEKTLIKAVINAVINPITAINKIQNGYLLNEPYCTQVTKTIQELTTLLNNENFKVNNAFTENMDLTFTTISSLVFDVARKTATNRSSMLEDTTNKRKTEIEFISGYFINEAKKVGIKLPRQENYFRTITLI